MDELLCPGRVGLRSPRATLCCPPPAVIVGNRTFPQGARELPEHVLWVKLFTQMQEPYTFIRNEDLLPNSLFSTPKVYKPLFEAAGDGSAGKSLEDVFYEHEVGPASSPALGFKHLLSGSPRAARWAPPSRCLPRVVQGEDAARAQL